MIIEWAREAVLDQMMAQVILSDPRWSREYLIYREFGHRSMFGEESVSELTNDQTKLLSLSQLYDVVRNAVSMSYGEEEKPEIPEDVLPYPGRLLRWYNSWQENNRRAQQLKVQGANPSKGKEILRDDEDDTQAFAAYLASRRESQEPSEDGGE